MWSSFHLFTIVLCFGFSPFTSWCIVVLGFCGLACGIYSALSCEWYAWTPLNETTAWGVFAVDEAANQAPSVGLFRYYFNKNKNALTTKKMFAPFSCRSYSKVGGHVWLLIPRSTDHWMFTAQLSWLIATVLAALSTASILCRCCSCFYRCWPCRCCRQPPEVQGKVSCVTACGWLFASGLQAASCLAATALCGGNDFWECPWLQGALASAGSAWFYLLCWLLSMCGYRLIHSRHSLVAINHRLRDRRRRRRRLEPDVEDEKQEDADDVEAPTAGSRQQYKMTAEELLGTNDPVIHRAVGQKAFAIREFAIALPMEDDDEESEADEHVLLDESAARRASMDKDNHSRRGKWKNDDSSSQATPKAKSHGNTATLEP